MKKSVLLNKSGFVSLCRSSIFPLYINVLSKQTKKGIYMCILGGFILILILSGIRYISLQVHCLETK